MFQRIPHRPVAFVLFGAAGDLSHRLILPALYALYQHGQPPERFALIGTDRISLSSRKLAAQYRTSLAQEPGQLAEGTWNDFAADILYLPGDLGDHALFAHLKEQVHTLEKRWGTKAERVFYFATPPGLFGQIADGLASAGLHRERQHTRIVVEKPLGSDLQSFLQINGTLSAHFHENQIYRIDHFLGKETVQNILALRFANPILERCGTATTWPTS